MEVKTISIGNAQKMGFGKVIDEAESNGLVALERNGRKEALVLPLTSVGLLSLFHLFREAANNQEALAAMDPKFREYLEYMVYIMSVKLGIQLKEAA